MLVDINDKPNTFVGSKEWIGSFEICLCLDQLYGVRIAIILFHCYNQANVYDILVND